MNRKGKGKGKEGGEKRREKGDAKTKERKE
jgi:hypothetical protein